MRAMPSQRRRAVVTATAVTVAITTAIAAALVAVACGFTATGVAAAAVTTQYYSAVRNANGAVELVQHGAADKGASGRFSMKAPFAPNELARVEYDPLYLQEGWDRLNVIGTNASGVEDMDVAWAAGYAEGKITAGHIYNHSRNTGVYGTHLSEKLAKFIDLNNIFIATSVASAKKLDPSSDEAIFWRHVALVYRQLEGISAGYNASEEASSHPMSMLDILRLNLDGDMEDLGNAVGDTEMPADRSTIASHCSALIRLLPKNEDLFIAQDTWSSFNSMTRIMKRYELPFSTSDVTNSHPVANKIIAFSSYPGVIFSGDDFYVLSSGRDGEKGKVMIETTIGNSNPDLNKFITHTTVLEWARNIVANRLGSDGLTWTKYYSKYNSGTYNNQNFFLDYNKFTPGKALQPNTVLMVEQIPGTIISTDVSWRIQQEGYFGSYNTAYNATIRKLSGADVNVQQFGSWFDYEQTARAQIFRRNHTFVTDLESMQALMRYDNYKEDPLSTQLNTCQFRGWTNCTPPYTTENTIACRGDLNPKDGVYSLSAFGQRNHVATDSKIATYAMFDKDTVPIRAISGPPNSQVPTFKWSTSPFATSAHHGMPDAWDFSWLTISWPN